MKTKIAGILALSLIWLSGCATQSNEEPVVVDNTPVETAPPVDTTPERVDPPVVVQQTQYTGPTEAELLAVTTLFFDFDRSDIRPENQAVIAAHARFLTENPQSRLRLEGHADERGSREYNVGLGEKRAQAVRRALSVQGVSTGQLSTLSYGEEKPLDTGHYESAWQANRRVELVYH